MVMAEPSQQMVQNERITLSSPGAQLIQMRNSGIPRSEWRSSLTESDAFQAI